MVLRSLKWMLTVLGAVSMMLVGCGGDEKGVTRCSQDTECLDSELCHPDAKVCVQTCTSSADCPEAAKNCEAVSATKTEMICKCSTSELCNRMSGAEGNLVCADAHKVCVPKCTENSDCVAGQVCDTASGVCKQETPPVNNTCSGEGKSTCAHGQFCSSNKCEAVPAPTCTNYQNFTEREMLGTTGPIIFNAAFVSAAMDGWCGAAAPKRVRVRVSAYSSTPFPATKEGLDNLAFWVSVNGERSKVTSTLGTSADTYVVTGDNRERADITMNFCVASTSQTLSLGFYFSNGNFYCYQASY
jgi:Cys-rich repeat protein